MLTNPMTKELGIAADPIHPQLVGIGDADTGGIDMRQANRALFVLDVGAFGVAATVDMKLQESTDDITYTDLPGFAITQLLEAGGDNKLATIEVRSSQLSKRYVRARVSVGGAGTTLSVLPLAANAHFSPAENLNIADVVENIRPAGKASVYRSSGMLVRNV